MNSLLLWQLNLLLSLFFFLFSLSAIFKLVSCQCLHTQSSALLQLKRGLNTTSSFSKLESWNPHVDCCSWEGVTCDDDTGYIVGLDLSNDSIEGGLDPEALSGLDRLQRLNLACNNFYPSPLPIGLDKLISLTHLNFSDARFSGEVPIEISRLTGLVSLDLSSSPSLTLENPTLEVLLANLTQLREVYLDDVNISSKVPNFLANFSSLTALSFRSCQLRGEFPEEIFRMPKLETLDISRNPSLTGRLPDFPHGSSICILALAETLFSGILPDSVGELRKLSVLDVGQCNFSGPIPPSLASLTQLSVLDLSENHFSGPIHSMANLTRLAHLYLQSNNFSGLIHPLENLTQLTSLDLSSNNFYGPISSSVINGFKNLESLNLKNNSFDGRIPTSLFSLLSLWKLGLSQNRFTGQLHEIPHASWSMLQTVDLSCNKLHGPIPESILKMKNLYILDLSKNNFNGALDLGILEDHMDMQTLDLSDNNLSINPDTDSSNFPRIEELSLASCNISQFPNFLRNQSSLIYLDLSNNRIQGEIPNWIWSLGPGYLTYLNLSHNLLESFEQPWPNISLIYVLDLNSNVLQGPLIIPSTQIDILDYSNNQFTFIPNNNSFSGLHYVSLSRNNISGEIPPSICNGTYLEVLDLSYNQFSGTIRQCLGEIGNAVEVVNLRGNFFRGTLPDAFPKECNLRSLNLNQNQLEGPLPASLSNCKMLEVLDLGNNKIKSTFPMWVATLLNLRVLVLRSNEFYGPIPLHPPHTIFPTLKIVDLSSNSFTGELPPEVFQNWKSMLVENGDGSQSEPDVEIVRYNYSGSMYYVDKVTLINKGREVEYVKILTIFASLDLANNRFYGEIPRSIGELRALHALNLSHNSFTGQIPASLGELKQLESLDLSWNKLCGEIPWQLTRLTFLSVLNLSHNLLVGQIPQGNQFLTFTGDSFQDNLGLCGAPLLRKCGNDALAPPESMEEFEWSSMWIGFECGYGVGLSLVLVTLVLWERRMRE